MLQNGGRSMASFQEGLAEMFTVNRLGLSPGPRPSLDHGFRKIRGCRDLGLLKAALDQSAVLVERGVA